MSLQDLTRRHRDYILPLLFSGLIFSLYFLLGYFRFDGAHPHLNDAVFTGWFTWSDQKEYLDECLAYRALDLRPEKLYYPPLYPLLHVPFGCSPPTFLLVDYILGLGSFLVLLDLMKTLTGRARLSAVMMVLSLALPNTWCQFIVPWTSNLSAFLTFFFLLIYFRAPDYFFRFGPILIFLQLVTRPLDCVIMALFYGFEAISRYRRTVLREIVMNRWSIIAVGLLILDLLFNKHVYGTWESRYQIEITQISGLNIHNFFLKGATLLFNPGTLYPDSITYPLMVDNAFFAIYILAFLFVAAGRVGIPAVYPVVLYFVSVSFNDLTPVTLIEVNSIHYFKTAFLLAYVFGAGGLINYFLAVHKETQTSSRRVVAGTLLWLVFLFGHVGIRNTPHRINAHVTTAKDYHVLDMDIDEHTCPTSSCLLETNAFYGEDSTPSYQAGSKSGFLSGPTPLIAPKDFRVLRFNSLNTGLAIIFNRPLPAGHYAFFLNKDLTIMPLPAHFMVTSISPLSIAYCKRLLHRWHV